MCVSERVSVCIYVRHTHTQTHTHTQSHLSTPIHNLCEQLTIIILCNVVHVEFFVWNFLFYVFFVSLCFNS